MPPRGGVSHATSESLEVAHFWLKFSAAQTHRDSAVPDGMRGNGSVCGLTSRRAASHEAMRLTHVPLLGGVPHTASDQRVARQQLKGRGDGRVLLVCIVAA